jgi:hydrogenase-4 component F
MGILVLGVGVGGGAVFGSMLHLLNNGLTKGVLFLSAGNIHRVYGSKLTGEVGGALRRLPVSGALFLAGFFAITGSPPFGPFLSELTILRGAFTSGQYGVAGLFLLALAMVFIGMAATVLAVVQGDPPEGAAAERGRDTLLTSAPPAALLGLVLLLGLYVPPPLDALLHDAAAWLEAP